MDEYVSLVDGHRHFGDAGRAECAVCRLETERDRLRDELAAVTAERERLTKQVTTLSIQGMGVETEYHDACAERDRLRAVVDHLRESAESAIGQDRDDEYDEGNRDAWLYVRNVIDGRAGSVKALDGEATDG
jgi:hypothetical protein